MLRTVRSDRPTTWQALATGFPVGKRFHSAPVIRLADAKPTQLGHAVEADGRWRIFAIAPAGDRGQAGGAMADLCEFLTSANDIYPVRGVDRQQGCLVVVRPDQYAAPVLPIAAYETLATFFGGFLSRV